MNSRFAAHPSRQNRNVSTFITGRKPRHADGYRRAARSTIVRPNRRSSNDPIAMPLPRTRLLVSVSTPTEATLAAEAGANLIDAKDPSAGPLGALTPETVSGIVAAVRAEARLADRLVTAVIGDHRDADAALSAADHIAATGVDMVKVGLYPELDRPALVAALGRRLAARTRLVAVLLADHGLDLSLVVRVADAGFAGVMIDTMGKGDGLLTIAGFDTLAGFIAHARSNGLMTGLAGSLKVDDIDRLVPLGPDLIGFRGGLCEGGDRTRPLAPERVRAAAARLGSHVALAGSENAAATSRHAAE